MENWTSSVTQTWWTSPWMCTEAFFLRRKSPKVSVDSWWRHPYPHFSSNNTHKTKEDINIDDRYHKGLLHDTTHSIQN